MDVLLLETTPPIADIVQSVLSGPLDRLWITHEVGESEAMLAEGKIDVLIGDPTTADLAGYDLMGRSLRVAPGVFRIAVSAFDSHQELTRAFNECRAQYALTHPVNAEEVATAINRATEHVADLGLKRQQSQQASSWTAFLEERVEEQNEGLAQAVEDILCTLVTALDVRENESAYHSRRVALSSLYLANHLKWDPDGFQDLYFGAMLHDVGKIGIRDAVLLKPDRLNPEERQHIESHIPIGVRLLSEIQCFSRILDIAHYHHERYDGAGYPNGLIGDTIPIAARLFAIIDVYDALRHARPYKGAMPHAATLAEMIPGRGSHFDPDIFDAFRTLPGEVWDELAELAPNVRSYTEALLACKHVMNQAVTLCQT